MLSVTTHKLLPWRCLKLSHSAYTGLLIVCVEDLQQNTEKKFCSFLFLFFLLFVKLCDLIAVFNTASRKRGLLLSAKPGVVKKNRPLLFL